MPIIFDARLHKQQRNSLLGTVFNMYSSYFFIIVILLLLVFIISTQFDRYPNFLIWIVWILNAVFIILFFIYSISSKDLSKSVLKYNIFYGVIIIFLFLFLFLKFIGRINPFTGNIFNVFSDTFGYIVIQNKVTKLLNDSLANNWKSLKDKFRLLNNWKHIIQNINKNAFKKIENLQTLNDQENNIENMKKFLLISNGTQNKLKNLIDTRDNINIIVWSIIIIILLYYITNNE